MLTLPIMFLDLETRAREDAADFLPEPTAPANYKDPAKIAEYVAAKQQEQLARAALDPDLGYIAAVGYRIYPAGEVVTLLTDVNYSESALLEAVWQVFTDCLGRACGYNIIGFDIPYLQRRSLVLGVKPLCPPRLGSRYANEPILDLMGALYGWQGGAKGLKNVARLLDIPNPLPDMDGSLVATMDADTLRAYVANDIAMIVALFEKMDGLYWPSVIPALV